MKIELVCRANFIKSIFLKIGHYQILRQVMDFKKYVVECVRPSH